VGSDLNPLNIDLRLIFQVTKPPALHIIGSSMILIYYFLRHYRASLCIPDGPWALDPPTSASWVLGLQVCTITPRSASISWTNGWLFPKQSVTESEAWTRTWGLCSDFSEYFPLWHSHHLPLFNLLKQSTPSFTLCLSRPLTLLVFCLFCCFSFGIVFLKQLFPDRFWTICDKGGTYNFNNITTRLSKGWPFMWSVFLFHFPVCATKGLYFVSVDWNQGLRTGMKCIWSPFKCANLSPQISTWLPSCLCAMSSFFGGVGAGDGAQCLACAGRVLYHWAERQPQPQSHLSERLLTLDNDVSTTLLYFSSWRSLYHFIWWLVYDPCPHTRT
jgi:hypothetical protein